MKKFLLVGLSSIIALTSVLGSCGSNQEDPNASADGATPTPVRDSNTVVIWWKSDSGDLNLLNDAWFDFKEMYGEKGNGTYKDDITMFTTDGNSNGTTELEMQIAGGTAPDLIRMDHVYVTKLGQNGNVFDLNKKFNFKQDHGDKFIPSTIEASSYKEATYGIPFDANTIIWGGKKAAMEKAGVSLPKTYEELLAAGNKLKTSGLGENVYPYTLPCGTDKRYNWPAFVFMFYVWRLGGNVLNDNLTEAVFNDTETGVKALNMMLELKEQGLISPTEYQEGESVFCDYGTWKLRDFKEDMEFSLLPALKEGGENWSGLGLYDLSVVSTSLNPQLAYDFAIHVSTGKNSLTDEHYMYRFAKQNQFLPPLLAAALDDDYDDPVQKKFWAVSLEQLAKSKYRPAVPCWPEIEENLSKAVMDAMNGVKAPAEALNTAKKAADALLAQYNK